ncbi:PaaI family thioesterase [Streptomyces sp. Caat 7-52]|uniref:PaaI family thioesterase n=1 Tax=Streptomyces sp. Caat 7-52 TaxID=2949637 RepID=UPI002035B5EF|nr:PaaI family thioesterase [Streptomyces sp. Caat 7-52]
MGTVHGGCLAALLDSALGTVVLTALLDSALGTAVLVTLLDSALGTAVLVTLLDSALGTVVLTALPAGRACTTGRLGVNLVRPVPATTPTLRREGRAVHVGRTTATAEARIVGAADGRLYAHGTATRAAFALPDAARRPRPSRRAPLTRPAPRSAPRRPGPRP